jgi:hypothetical protein
MNDFSDAPKRRFRRFPRQARGLMDDLFRQEQQPVQPARPEIVPDRFSIRLNSLVKGATFGAVFDVEFYGEGDGAQLRDRLRLKLQQVAEEMAAALNVTHSTNLQNLINEKLNNQWEFEGITVVRASVGLRVTDDALAVGQKWEKLSGQQSLDRLRRAVELEELTYLRDEIYSKPEVARGRWLRDHPNEIDELLDDRFDRIAEKFRQSKASAGGAADAPDAPDAPEARDAPEAPDTPDAPDAPDAADAADAPEAPDAAAAAQALMGQLFFEFLAGLSDAERAPLSGQLGRVFTSYGRDDLRERLG